MLPVYQQKSYSRYLKRFKDIKGMVVDVIDDSSKDELVGPSFNITLNDIRIAKRATRRVHFKDKLVPEITRPSIKVFVPLNPTTSAAN